MVSRVLFCKLCGSVPASAWTVSSTVHLQLSNMSMPQHWRVSFGGVRASKPVVGHVELCHVDAGPKGDGPCRRHLFQGKVVMNGLGLAVHFTGSSHR